MNEDVECPYCEKWLEVCQDDGYACDPTYDEEHECGECGKFFILSVDWSPDFDAEEAPCLNGEKHKYLVNVTKQLHWNFYRMKCISCRKEKDVTELSEMKKLDEKLRTRDLYVEVK